MKIVWIAFRVNISYVVAQLGGDLRDQICGSKIEEVHFCSPKSSNLSTKKP